MARWDSVFFGLSEKFIIFCEKFLIFKFLIVEYFKIKWESNIKTVGKLFPFYWSTWPKEAEYNLHFICKHHRTLDPIFHIFCLRLFKIHIVAFTKLHNDCFFILCCLSQYMLENDIQVFSCLNILLLFSVIFLNCILVFYIWQVKNVIIAECW